MTADALSSQDRPAFSRALKAGAVVSAIFAAGFAVVGLRLSAARTDRAVAPETQASTSVAPASRIERSGTMIAHELLF